MRPQLLDGRVDDALAPGHGGDVLGHGHGLAAGGLDLLHHGLGDLARGVLPGQAHADVGHHDLGTLGRARQGAGPADAAARPGDHDHLALEVPSHVPCHSCLVGPARRAAWARYAARAVRSLFRAPLKSDGTLAAEAKPTPAGAEHRPDAGVTAPPQHEGTMTQAKARAEFDTSDVDRWVQAMQCPVPCTARTRWPRPAPSGASWPRSPSPSPATLHHLLRPFTISPTWGTRRDRPGPTIVGNLPGTDMISGGDASPAGWRARGRPSRRAGSCSSTRRSSP